MNFADTSITRHWLDSDGRYKDEAIPDSAHLERLLVEPCALEVRLNRPASRNAISNLMVDEFNVIFDLAERQESEVRAIVLKGDTKSFCSGADLDSLRDAKRLVEAGDDGAARSMLERIYQVFLRPLRSPIAVVACVDGAAVGAGLNVALAADIRLVTPSAYFESRFLKIGLHPGGGHTWLLDRILGPSAARGMALFNERIDSKESIRIGLAKSGYSNADESMRAALELTRPLMTADKGIARQIKTTLASVDQLDHSAALAKETEIQVSRLRALNL